MHPRLTPSSSRVALLIPTASSWGRKIIAGVHRYAQAAGSWRLFIADGETGMPTSLPKRWKGDGVIARVSCVRMARQLHACGLPVVNVSAIQLPGPEFPRVTNDVEAVARMAADYFLRRGYRHFAYLSLRGVEYVQRQKNAFEAAVASAGCSFAVHGVDASEQHPDWSLDVPGLRRWLRSLPKPVALLTWRGGQEVIHACEEAGLRIPEDVALLSGSDDDLLCQVSPIPISGVSAAGEQIGWHAAALLDKLMRGRRVPRRELSLFLPPAVIVSRQSTDALAITDPAIAAALSFIRKNAAEPLPVGEIARHSGLSRCIMERRFRKLLGCSPAVYVKRLHIDRAKELLAATDRPISEIAEASGFGSAEYMSYVFRREVGFTPLRYRRTARV